MTTTSATTPTSTVNTVGSSTILTGIASGLDTDSLIKAAMAQRTAPADALDAKVTAAKAKIAAYTQLQTLVNALSTSMSSLASSNFSSVASAASAFQNKAVSLTSSDASTATSYMAVSATSSAAATSYNVTVDQLATAEKDASSAMDSTTALNQTGAFTLSDGVGAPQTVSVTATMTLSDVANAINAVSTTSGVSATMIQVSTGSYKLVLSANDTNHPITATPQSGDDVLQTVGLLDGDNNFVTNLQAAKPALVTIDGTQVTSDTNNLTDAVSGLNISLLKTTPTGTTVNMAVQPDYSGVKTAITGFVTAYNALRTFVNANQVVGADGTVDAGATLFADSLLRGATQTIGSILSTPAASATGDLTTLANLGVSLGTDSTLTADDTTLDNALLGDLPDVAAMFQTAFTTSNSALKVLQNTSLTAFNFTLDVTASSDGTITGASVGGDSSLFTVTGNRITGNPGTAYDGLSFALVANADTSISVSIKPGLANQIDNFASLYGDANNGLLQQQINTMTDQDTAWAASSAQIRSDATAYQTTLVNKYAKMEQEVSSAQLMQQQIQAVVDGQNHND